MSRVIPLSVLLALSCGRTDLPLISVAETVRDAGLPVFDAGARDAGTPDAGTPDAGTPDAGIPDAGTLARGFIDVHEVSIEGFGNSGMGLWVRIHFEDEVRPVLEEQPASIYGCKAWEYQPRRGPSVNAGLVQISSTLSARLFPPACEHEASGAYACVVARGSAGTIDARLGPVPGSLTMNGGVGEHATLTVSSPLFGPEDRGRFMRIAGSSGGNDGALTGPWGNSAYLMSSQVFPVLAPASPEASVRYGTPSGFGSDEVLGPGSEWSLVVGAGSNPFLSNHFLGPARPLVALLNDVDRLSVSLGNRPLATAVDVADAFYLTTESQSTILGYGRPNDGSAFSIGCRDDYEGCESDTVATVEFETTDAPVPFADGLYFPPAVSRTVRIRCSTPNSITATVPGAYLQLLANSGATRIRTTFSKSRVVEATASNGAPVVVSLGHAMVGFGPR